MFEDFGASLTVLVLSLGLPLLVLFTIARLILRPMNTKLDRAIRLLEDLKAKAGT